MLPENFIAEVEVHEFSLLSPVFCEDPRDLNVLWTLSGTTGVFLLLLL